MVLLMENLSKVKNIVGNNMINFRWLYFLFIEMFFNVEFNDLGISVKDWVWEVSNFNFV